MHYRLTIGQRILAIFLVVVVSGAVLQFIVAGRQLQVATLEFFQHHLETDALLVSATFAEPLGHYLGGENSANLGRILSTLQDEVGHNYLIVSHDYRVIGYTPHIGYENLGSVPETPELQQATLNRLGADIRSNANGESMLYVAVSVMYENRLLGYLILSEAMQPAYNEVLRHYIELAGATIPILVMVIVASLWVAHTISRPIQVLRTSAMKMAQGALDTRLEITSSDEIGDLGETFNYMASQIEKLMKTQRSFVSNAAHELRTPLMTIKLRAEALTDEVLSTTEREAYLREICQEIDHMAALVSSLLMLARIDEARHSGNGVITDTVSTLHDIVRNWRIEAEKKGLEFRLDLAPQLPELPMSANDLRLILDNLLSNAIKYTQQGYVSFRVQYTQQQFVIEISDTGVGFRCDQATLLFERFYRSEQVRGKYNGNGLGLSVAKAILGHYGGQLEGYSAGIGTGATFTMRLSATPVLKH